ncbi:CRISPR-associated helicase Cas3' [Corynebacterium sp. NPDC060344]|uniref:CRISPR-associated helicase Cas3' n=1 Tax=Corynebacterium sp. NPDC060344 TaxID=3347101 RepID=UPI00365F64C3
MNVDSGPDRDSGLFERLSQFTAQASPELTAMWAKSGDDSGWLSLPQHLADAAAVSSLLWEHWVSDSVKRFLEDKLDMDEPDLRTLLTFLAGAHDVGKATLKFERQIEKTERGREILDDLATTGLPLAMSTLEAERVTFPHGLAGEAILHAWLLKQGCKKQTANSIAPIIGAHHGVATNGDDLKHAERLLKDYAAPWVAVHDEILDGMSSATGFATIAARLPKKLHADSAMLLAGLIVMSDWIASNSDVFPMTPHGTLEDRARKGFLALGLTGPWNAEASLDDGTDAYYRQAFDWPDSFGARPIQRVAIDAIAQSDGPCLMIVEAPTGEGKTEAALAIGHLIAAATGAQGLLLATPTMGTSNGLFPRARDWAALNTPTGHVTSMNLVHSRKHFSKDFEQLRTRGIAEDAPGAHGSVVASQWFNGPKRALLSNFVVATVDQVLMMALQMRYSMLRHIGLAGKVIIIDEVHSYDLYMGSYLKKALQWLARYGASVVLLSATLPKKEKLELVRAYGGQLSDEIPDDLSVGYPLLTAVDRHGVREHDVESRPTDLNASIDVIPDSLEDLAGVVESLVSDGGCLLIICNTVRRAQETYRMLAGAYADDVELHHSAFMAAERSQREDELRIALGPESHRGAGRPDRKIIVSTQVAEQSLDIDADALITDIAPMDLMIQRIGRIHRHARPDTDRPANLREPKVYVRAIEELEPIPVFEGGTAAIYAPAILMSTLANLPSSFRRPDDISHLVQATYSPTFTPPDAWATRYGEWKTEMTASLQLSEKRASTFQIPEPQYSAKIVKLFERYHRSMEKSAAGEEAGAAQVRDSDPTFEVIPIISTDYGYRVVPIPGEESPETEFMDDAEPDRSTAFRLASSVLRLPARFSRRDSVFKRVIDKLELETPIGWSKNFLLKGHVALRLDENGEVELDGQRLRYSSELGLEQVRQENK